MNSDDSQPERKQHDPQCEHPHFVPVPRVRHAVQRCAGRRSAGVSCEGTGDGAKCAGSVGRASDHGSVGSGYRSGVLYVQ